MKKIIPMLICFQLFFSFKGNCSSTYSIDVTVYGNPGTLVDFNATGYSINGQVIEYSGFTVNPSIHIVIIDSSTCQPLNNCNRNFGQVNIFTDPNGDCITDPNTTYISRARPENYFIYRSNEVAGMRSMAHLLDSVADGNFILAYTWFPNIFSTTDSSFRNVFQRLGSALIPALADSLPFIFFCKKGDAGTVLETSGFYSNSVINLNVIMQCSPLGLSEILPDNQLNIYPNPVSEELQVKLKHPSGEVASLQVFDVLGHVVNESISTDDDVRIDTKDLANGFYYLRVHGKEHSSEGKFIVIHD